MDEKIEEQNANQAPRWLLWAREIQAIAQTGCHYANNDFDLLRYQRLREIASEIISAQSDLDGDMLLALFRPQLGYATPRVDVRAAVFEDGKLLMVRERMDGGWTMPGGWADVGDVPSQAAEREALEESGYTVQACKVIGVYDANRSGPLELFHAFKIVFLCKLLGGEARTSFETTDVGFFTPHDIPQPLSGERTKPKHIRDAFAALADINIPTVFD